MDRVGDIIRDLVKPHKIMDKKREDIRETSPPERALAPGAIRALSSAARSPAAAGRSPRP